MQNIACSLGPGCELFADGQKIYYVDIQQNEQQFNEKRLAEYCLPLLLAYMMQGNCVYVHSLPCVIMMYHKLWLQQFWHRLVVNRSPLVTV
jgi:hypothetical protein